MKRSLNRLVGFSVKAKDGDKGSVKDFLFDEERWTIRYLEVKLGNIFKNRKVLIPRVNLGEPEWMSEHFPVNLDMEVIEKSPGIDFDSPVSRRYEQMLFNHYAMQPYWAQQYAGYSGIASMLDPNRPVPSRYPEKVVDENDIDTSLRSFNEVRGYTIESTDDRFGHIEDLIIEDENWHVFYVVIDTKDLLPWSKKVMLPIEVISEISYVGRKATIKMTRDDIEAAPEFDPSMAVNEEYEKVLYDFYGRKIKV
ncbi:PRC-barrel domain-containing protein [Saccharicrinis sp. FJH62]|uniref:PRC-barrel domain-containing protein n=1 Tax=Saccharicrinis sp. FJH62 TaxID=3344657 RepID=UPI0035D4D934